MTKKEFEELLKNITSVAVKKANKFLKQLNLTLHINWEYSDWEYDVIGIYERNSVFEEDISIGVNISNFYKWFIKESKDQSLVDSHIILDEAIQTTIFHEMGHGIVELINHYLQETDELDNIYDNNQELFDDVLDNEEESVENLAWAIYDNQLNSSDLYKAIQLVLVEI